MKRAAVCRVALVVATLVWCVVSGLSPAGAQSPASATTKQHVEALASEKPDGRLTGSPGERVAADYIVSQLQRIGAKPLAGLSDYRVPFEFTAARSDGGSSVSIDGKRSDGVEWSTTFRPVRALSFSDNSEVSGQLVFAGYGIVVPDGQDFGYDSYAGLDVKDKIVLVLLYFPEDAEPKVKALLARYSDLRYKAMAARQRGAKAILVATGPRSPN